MFKNEDSARYILEDSADIFHQTGSPFPLLGGQDKRMIISIQSGSEVGHC